MTRVLTELGGDSVEVSRLDVPQLEKLHYEEELAYALKIRKAEPFSNERSALMKKGYEFVHGIMSEISARENRDLFVGASEKKIKLITDVVRNYKKTSGMDEIVFFEGGIGTGSVLKAVAELESVEIKGCDVYLSPLYELPEGRASLFEGTVYEVLSRLRDGSINIFYWNDVIEHIPEDEINAYMRLIHKKVSDNGLVVTLTPNWHIRPSDITGKFEPRGTEAKGFHFKEYTYREMTKLLKSTGFGRIRSPLMYNPLLKRYILANSVFSRLVHGLKLLAEPLSYVLPYALKKCFILAFAFSITIAAKNPDY